MDGVIADTEPLAIEATIEVFREASSVTVALDDMMQFMGSTARAYFSALAQKYAPDADVDILIEAHDRKLHNRLRQARDLALPGVRSLFIRASSDVSCRIGLATGSGRRRSRATLAACSLPEDAIRAWCTGDDINQPKPDPEIYQMTAKALELNPSQCVAIEDSIAGVASAKSAGLVCVAVTNTFSADALAEADHVVDSLEGLAQDFLRSLV